MVVLIIQIANSSSAVPLSTQWNAINLLQLRDRAVEEEDRMTCDMKTAVDHFCSLHAELVEKANSPSTPLSLQALLMKKIRHLETIMTDVWLVVSKYVKDIRTLPRVVVDVPVEPSTDESAEEDDIDLNDLTSTLTPHDMDSDSESEDCIE